MKPECRTVQFAQGRLQVSVHDLSPLSDKILIGVVEVGEILRTKVVPRIHSPFTGISSRGLFCFIGKTLKAFPIKQKRSAWMRTRAYKEDVAVATALGARVRMRTLCSRRGIYLMFCAVCASKITMYRIKHEENQNILHN